MSRLGRLSAGLVLAVVTGGAAGSADPPNPSEAEPTAELEIVRVIVEPARPGPETLCELRVVLSNRGRHAASRFRFAVRVAGQPLEIYGNQLFLQPVPAAAQHEVELFKFWSSESGRPYPDGPLTVEVRLEAASWMRIEATPSGEERTPIGPVSGLSISKRL
ncbi:MAG: hypothetical protein AAF560_34430, partial [Acidobacteriota bacterium]